VVVGLCVVQVLIGAGKVAPVTAPPEGDPVPVDAGQG
jgi:hypothetical protein